MKVVIIGGGVSGLTAGIYLQQAGFDTELYEKNPTLGGECTGWDRGGYHIDNCIHWLMGTTPGGDLYDIWHTVGVLDAGLHHADKMYTSVLGGESLTLWADMERTKAEMLALSPGDAAATEELMKDAAVGAKCAIPAGKPPELMGAMEGIKFGLSMREPLSLMKKYAGTDTGDLAAKFRHPLIRCLISDFCPKESLGYSFPIAYGNFTSGDGGVPVGGSKAAAQRMRARYEELGGRVFAPAVALKFAVEGDLITGLLLKDGTFVKGDFFVAACDLWVTFDRLMGWHYAEEKIREMYENRTAYPVYGMFQAAYAVDSGEDATEDAIDGDVIMDFKAEEPWMNGRVSVKTYAYEPGFAPPGKQIVQALLGLTEEAYDVWSKLDKDRPAYEAKKMELANRLRQRIEAFAPAYKDKMTLLDTWTPMTYERWCCAFKGYNQAFTLTKRSAKNPYPAAYVKGLKNVVLSGQWLSPPGGLPGAAIQGKYAAIRIASLAEKM